jgi:hypothetical protein
MGWLGRRSKQLASYEEPTVSAAPRGAYEIDEHQISPQELAQRFGTTVDWSNVQGSRGLTTEQVNIQYLLATLHRL